MKERVAESLDVIQTIMRQEGLTQATRDELILNELTALTAWQDRETRLDCVDEVRESAGPAASDYIVTILKNQKSGKK